MSFDWVMNGFLSCVTFCCQNESFSAKRTGKLEKIGRIEAL